MRSALRRGKRAFLYGKIGRGGACLSMSVHCRLSIILGEKRIKMAELVRMTGVSKTTINAMYHDRVQKIDYLVIDRICKALDCNISDLIEYIPEEDSP